MAFKRDCNFTDINFGVDASDSPGVVGGILIVSAFIITIFSVIGSFWLNDYGKEINDQRCFVSLKNNQKTSCATEYPSFVSLITILRGSNSEAANELKRSFQVLTREGATVEKWALAKASDEVSAGKVTRVDALDILCKINASKGMNHADMVCHHTAKVVNFYNKGVVAPAKTYLTMYAIAVVVYLTCGLFFLGRFLCQFGKPSGGVIVWMVIFAPLFIPLWTALGLGAIGLLIGKKMKISWADYSARRMKEKSEAEEELVVGEDIIAQRKKIAYLRAEAQTELNEKERKGLLQKLDIAQKLIDDEAENRKRIHQEATERQTCKNKASSRIAQEVDEITFQAEAHRDMRRK